MMNTLLNNMRRQIPFQMAVLKKIVDDLILALPADQIDMVLDMLNVYNPHIQFTKEEDIDGKLPFMDMVVTRNPDQTLSTQWYAKPIASGRLLNYWSLHPLSMKINVTENLILRVNQTLQQQKQMIS